MMEKNGVRFVETAVVDNWNVTLVDDACGHGFALMFDNGSEDPQEFDSHLVTGDQLATLLDHWCVSVDIGAMRS